MVTNIKRSLISHAANIIGWKTNRKIVVMLSDDWGSVHTASKSARDQMIKKGLAFEKDRFDYYDALENESDLIGLYDVLTSVKDKYGNHAVMTPYTVVTNPDFEKMRDNNFSSYHYELLPDTFAKLPGYENVWSLWKKGIESGIFMPQFHGRQHFNIKIMMDGLQSGNPQMIECFNRNSWAGVTNVPYYLSAYSFQSPEENEKHVEDLADGIEIFRKIFEFSPEHFVPPQGKYNRILEGPLKKMGINFLDVSRIRHEPQLNGSNKKVYTYLGMKSAHNQKYIVRNCMLENINPSGIDWVDFCLNSIDAAFRMRSPAVITPHRVNFVGHIEPSNRDNGLRGLKRLLKTVTKKWPNVEFLSLEQLGKLMIN